MRMKQQDPNMAQNVSSVFAAVLAQPEKTPTLVSHAVLGRADSSIAETSFHWGH